MKMTKYDPGTPCWFELYVPAGEHGWYAFVSDPQGAHFGVFQYAKVPA